MADQYELTNPETYRFWEPEKVRFADLDMVGHVNNSAISSYFEQARVALLHGCGGFQESSSWTVVIARSLIEYKSELLYPATVRTGVKITRLGNTSLGIGSAIFLGDRCIATHEGVCVIVDKATHRPIPLPESLRTALAAY